MRNLMFKDVFTMSRIITKAGIKKDLERIVSESDSSDKLSLGIDFALGIMAGVSDEKVEAEIYKFLADVLECDVKDIEEGDPMTVINRLTNDEGHEQWSDFFTNVWKLLQKKT